MTDAAPPELIERRARELMARCKSEDYPPESQESIVAWLLSAPELRGLSTEALDHAATFYRGSKGTVRITEVVSGHLHNAADKLRRSRPRDVLIFTVLAMDAEIASRDAARAQENPNG